MGASLSLRDPHARSGRTGGVRVDRSRWSGPHPSAVGRRGSERVALETRERLGLDEQVLLGLALLGQRE